MGHLLEFAEQDSLLIEALAVVSKTHKTKALPEVGGCASLGSYV